MEVTTRPLVNLGVIVSLAVPTGWWNFLTVFLACSFVWLITPVRKRLAQGWADWIGSYWAFFFGSSAAEWSRAAQSVAALSRGQSIGLPVPAGPLVVGVRQTMSIVDEIRCIAEPGEHLEFTIQASDFSPFEALAGRVPAQTITLTSRSNQ